MTKKKILFIVRDILITIALLTIATGIGVLFKDIKLQETTIVVVYILSVMLVARFTNGYLYGITASILSIFLFSYFFTYPYYNFKVDDPVYFITFAIMAITSISTSALTSKVKRASIISKEREYESNVVYKMTNLLTEARTEHEIASIICKSMSDILSCNTAIICFNEQGKPESSFIQQKDGDQIRRSLDDAIELSSRLKGNTKPFIEGKEFYDYPFYDDGSILGVLRIPCERASLMSEIQNRITYSVLESCSLAMQRLRSIKAQAKAHEEATKERYRGNLLRAISHDIRTPLSGIMGSGEMLMGMTDKADPRYEISQGIYTDACWLHSLVENILNLTRLEDGRLMLNKEPMAIEEVIGASISLIEKRSPGNEINVTLPEEIIFVNIDARLISQVIINLLDNAIKHSDKNAPIDIVVEKDDKNAIISILDNGSGINPNNLDKIFEMFYTTRGGCVDSQRGMGLGLSICESIIDAHGGSIRAENRSDTRGAKFIFTLPLGGEINE